MSFCHFKDFFVNLPKSRSDEGIPAASGVTAVAGVTVVHWRTICYSNIPAVAGAVVGINQSKNF
jgi:hypothetical protein